MLQSKAQKPSYRVAGVGLSYQLIKDKHSKKVGVQEKKYSLQNLLLRFIHRFPTKSRLEDCLGIKRADFGLRTPARQPLPFPNPFLFKNKKYLSHHSSPLVALNPRAPTFIPGARIHRTLEDIHASEHWYFCKRSYCKYHYQS